MRMRMRARVRVRVRLWVRVRLKAEDLGGGMVRVRVTVHYIALSFRLLLYRNVLLLYCEANDEVIYRQLQGARQGLLSIRRRGRGFCSCPGPGSTVKSTISCS